MRKFTAQNAEKFQKLTDNFTAMTNPNIAEAGKATQFKEGNTPIPPRPNATKPWSVQNSLRYIAAQDADSIFKPKTRAQKIALSQVEKAEEGDTRAAEFVTERIDGKLMQPNLNADLAAIQGMSEEELHDLISKFDTLAGKGTGGTGVTEAPGSEGAVTEDRSEHAASGDTAGL